MKRVTSVAHSEAPRWHALRHEGRGESLASFTTLPTPIANRFGRATLWPSLVLFCLPLASLVVDQRFFFGAVAIEVNRNLVD